MTTSGQALCLPIGEPIGRRDGGDEPVKVFRCKAEKGGIKSSGFFLFFNGV
jgi:hypothetical protein